MTNAPIDVVELGAVGGLPARFLEGRETDLLAPLEFLAPGPDAIENLVAKAAATDRSAAARGGLATLAEGLAGANAAYGHPAAQALATKLADPATAVVVTGQQPGLLGGPLYSLTKAVAAAIWAERLEEAGQPAVAVFWVATEDHDFAEVARASFPTRDGLRTFDLGEDPSPLLPVGMRELGEGMETLLGDLGESFPGDRYGAWVGELGRWYRPQARFGEAFSRLFVRLLGDRCPLMLDAMLAETKHVEQDPLRVLIDRRTELEEAYRERDREIEARGHALQVASQPGASPLFLLDGWERRRIEWTADGWTLRGAEGRGGAIEDLLERLDDNPALVSPGVLARPAIQDAILGTTLQVLGPGELAYMPQAAVTHRILGIDPPMSVLRPQVLVAEAHVIDKLEELGVPLAEFLADGLDLDRLLSGGETAAAMDPVRAAVAQALQPLEERALGVDESLAGPLGKTRSQIDRALEAFGGRLSAAVARRDEVRRGRAERIAESVRPGGRPQERTVSSAHFPGLYGDGFVDVLFKDVDPNSSSLQVVTP